MICEAIVEKVLCSTDRLLLHFDISGYYIGNCLPFFGSMYRLECYKKCFSNFWVIICKGFSFQSCVLS